MSTLRKDPISGCWVIIAEERGLRPTDFLPAERPPQGREDCPFCHGNESKTPHEIRAERPHGGGIDTPGWTIRVVPNKYAAMRIEGELQPLDGGLYDSMNGIGAHEVIIETERHTGRLAEFSDRKVTQILSVYRERTIDLHRDNRFRYVQIFRNYGALAGASLEHPHSQLIALPIPPRRIAEELERASERLAKVGRCIFCEVIEHELAERSRIVVETDEFVAFAPYAARFPYETWIFPKAHDNDFQNASDDQLLGLGRILRRTLWALQRGLNDPPFNYVIHSAPELLEGNEGVANIRQAYHWHLEIIPRLTKLAGFEWGTGFYINPTAPEVAAAIMREALALHPEPPSED